MFSRVYVNEDESTQVKDNDVRETSQEQVDPNQPVCVRSFGTPEEYQHERHVYIAPTSQDGLDIVWDEKRERAVVKDIKHDAYASVALGRPFDPDPDTSTNKKKRKP